MGAELTIAVDTTIHELEAIRRACYAFSDKYSIHLERVDADILAARCSAKAGEVPADFSRIFNDALIDHGIRVSLARETAEIRDLIYRQAFVEADL